MKVNDYNDDRRSKADKKAGKYGSTNSENNQYMKGMKVPPDFGHAYPKMSIKTNQGPGGKVVPEPCQYASSYDREAYNYKY